MVSEMETNVEASGTSTAKISSSGETPPNPLSKRQQKKQKKLAEYAILRRERRLKEREKQKQKRRAAIEQGISLGPTRKELKKRQTALTPETASIQVAIDLDYDDLMSEKDIAKCVKQCLRIYTINRRSQHPGKLHLTGIKSDGHIHNSFKRNDGWENWHLQYHFDETHTEAFEKDKLVYLTCESDTVLEKLDTNSVYIIGGLVDHNHQKGLCHDRANKAGLKTARLPLSEHVDMKTRSVLSTYHVFEILLRVAEGSSWSDAILATIPMRKGAKPKEQDLKQVESKEQDQVDS